MRFLWLPALAVLAALSGCNPGEAGVVQTILGNWLNVNIQSGTTNVSCPGSAQTLGGTIMCGPNDRLLIKADNTYEFSEGGNVVDAGTYVEDANARTFTTTSTMLVDGNNNPLVTEYTFFLGVQLVLTGPVNGQQVTRYYAR